MKTEDIVAIALRLFSIGLAIYWLNNMPGMVAYFAYEELQSTMFVFAGLSVLVFVIVVLLWNFPMLVASKIVPSSKEIISDESWNKDDVLTCGLIILGIYFLFHVISDSIYWFFLWKLSANYQGVHVELNADQIAQIFATAVEAIVTVFLLFGSRRISNTILRLRYMGQ